MQPGPLEALFPEDGPTPDGVELLLSIVKRSVPNEETAADVLQDWYLERLYEQSHLSNALGRAETPGQLRAILGEDFRQYMSAVADRTELDNLVARASELLDGMPGVESRGEDRWALRDRRSGPPVGERRPLRLATLSFTDEELRVRRFGEHAARASEVLPDAELRRLLEAILAAAAGPVTRDDIRHVLAWRFELRDAVGGPLGTAGAEPAAGRSGDDHDEARAIALTLHGVFAPEHAAAIIALSEHRAFARAGAALGVHANTVKARYRDALSLIAPHVSGADQARLVIDYFVLHVRQGVER